jgi:hypothetical protein
METAQQIVLLLRRITESGTAVVMTTHNTSLLQEFPGIVYRCINQRLEDITNDYAIVDADGDYKAYQVAEDAPCYVQYPGEDKIHGFVTQEELRNYLGKNGDGKLLELILDKDDKVTFIYEPYTP